MLLLILPMLAVYAAFYALVPLTMEAMIPGIFREKILMVNAITRAFRYASLILLMPWAAVFDMLGALISLMILGSAFLAILISTLVFLALKHDSLANPRAEDLSFYRYLGLRSVGEGFKLILRESWMFKLILYLSLNIVPSTAVSIYIVAIANIVIGPQAYAYSILLIVLGIPAIAGAIISPRFIRKISVVSIIVFGIAAYFILKLILAIGVINGDPPDYHTSHSMLWLLIWCERCSHNIFISTINSRIYQSKDLRIKEYDSDSDFSSKQLYIIVIVRWTRSRSKPDNFINDTPTISNSTAKK